MMQILQQNRQNIGKNWPKLACFCAVDNFRFAVERTSGTDCAIDGQTAQMSAYDAPIAVQTMCRPRPVMDWLAFVFPGMAGLRHRLQFTLVPAAPKAQGCGIDLQKQGTLLCLRHPGSSPQLQHSASPVVWNPTSNARPLAPQQALSPLTRSALTARRPRLLAHLLVCCVTTQVSAARLTKLSKARFRADTFDQTPPGFRPGGVFAF